MTTEDERWAIFWCDLLRPVLFCEIEPSQTNQFLKELSQKEVLFPNGQWRKPSLSTLRRKLNRYRNGGFAALARKPRSDCGKARSVSPEVIATAVELKKEQPRRSHETINRFLEDLWGVTVPRSTLYRHLKEAHATRLKLGIVKKKLRRRFTRDHTHDLWLGDFEHGPYVLVENEVLPTYLSAFIDCHSRFVVEARYYLRQNLDILVDSLIRALATHGAPAEIYLDNAKVYHAHALKAACYRIHTRLIYRPLGDPAAGGLIERFFQSVQDQFEAEVRAADAMPLDKLNRAFSAWLAVGYHQRIHSETGQSPQQRYQKGLTVIRQVDLQHMLDSFMQRVCRRVHRDFSDVQVNKRFFRVDPKWRGDQVEVRYDPFSALQEVHIYSLKGVFLGKGTLHHRELGALPVTEPTAPKPKHDLLDLMVRQHQQQLAEKTKGIDYRKALQRRPWPFHAFAKSLANLLGKTTGLTAFNAEQLETLKKFYDKNPNLNEHLLKEAFAQTHHKSLPYVLHEIQEILSQKENS